VKNGSDFPEIVDLVVHKPKTDEWELIIVETNDEKPTTERLRQLQEKINNYVAYALDGQMAEENPNSVGRPVGIRLDYYCEPDDDLLAFVEWFGEQLREDGIGFTLSVRSLEPA
jgi:hypothetical protein